MRFRDRETAGRQLAALLERFRDEDPVVLALPRGGVAVGAEIAGALGALLDVLVVRKLGAPFQPELGVGAVAEGGVVIVDRGACEMLGITDEEIEEVAAEEAIELERRVRKFRGERPPVAIAGRTAILVDDGVATGGTAQAAIRAARARGPKRLVFATPVAAADTAERLRVEVDDLVCLDAPIDLMAVGAWYGDFRQVSDAEVVALLDRFVTSAGRAAASAGDGDDSSVHVIAGRVALTGDLILPEGARGLVLFAHGSGSSRMSPRNRRVAELLREGGLATLLFDLLTDEEESVDQYNRQLRFDVDLLAHRLVGATDWVRHNPPTRDLHIGYFGASTGAAAALLAAAQRPDDVGAVVSRGGRPDLAAPALPQVRAPTLLIVGEDDPVVLELNRQALDVLPGDKRLATIPGASHLFEEPGTLEAVAQLARRWFEHFLVAAPERGHLLDLEAPL